MKQKKQQQTQLVQRLLAQAATMKKIKQPITQQQNILNYTLLHKGKIVMIGICYYEGLIDRLRWCNREFTFDTYEISEPKTREQAMKEMWRLFRKGLPKYNKKFIYYPENYRWWW